MVIIKKQGKRKSLLFRGEKGAKTKYIRHLVQLLKPQQTPFLQIIMNSHRIHIKYGNN